MDWNEISIEDKNLFDRYFAIKRYAVSDYTFTNLFIWHFSRLIHYTIIDDFLCIKVTLTGKKPTLFMPLGKGNLKPALEKLIAEDSEFRMRALSSEMTKEIESAMPGKFTFAPERDRFDYVYKIADLIILDGTKFKAKRNHINMFEKMYKWHYEPMSMKNKQEVADSEIEWCKKRDCESQEGLENEKRGILEAVEHFERLNFKGGLLKIDGKTIAFAFAEPLTDDTAVIHVEKGDPDIRGAYQMINHQFLKNEWQNMQYVNREEDLGIIGLRKAKMSYHPLKMIEKFTAAM